jgi:MFS transporter, MHS family, alpha-ketoglutarate permease
MSTHEVAEAPHKLLICTLIAASVGNAVEWYDWTIYATFSIYFATQIFSAENESLAFILTFTTYALAFFFRPLGGFLLGRYADLKGRTQATADYHADGWRLAGHRDPPDVRRRRLARPDPPAVRSHRPRHVARWGGVQGSAYVAEIAPPNRRGRYSSFFYISTGTAVLLASLLGAFLASTLADPQLTSWGWRIPFLIGSALGLVGLWMRRDMAETEQFEKNVAKAKAIKNPLMLTLREYPKSVAQLIGLTLLSTLCYYTFFSALTPFAVKRNGLDDSMVFWALSIATALFVVLQYPFGWTADHFGRKPQLLVWVGRDRAADGAGLDADTARGGLRVGAAGVLFRSRSLRDEELDRPGDHERAVPDQAAVPRHRYLV